jgi:hypothetical protein
MSLWKSLKRENHIIEDVYDSLGNRVGYVEKIYEWDHPGWYRGYWLNAGWPTTAGTSRNKKEVRERVLQYEGMV